MNEHIVAAVCVGDKAVALIRVEPFTVRYFIISTSEIKVIKIAIIKKCSPLDANKCIAICSDPSSTFGILVYYNTMRE